MTPRLGWVSLRFFWSYYAAFYDRIWDSAVTERIAGAVGDRLQRDDTVLDFGCGTGLISGRLAARGHRVVAVDPSRAMLGRARSGHRAAEFVLADRPQKGRRFGAVIAVNVLHLAASPERVLESLFAVTDGLVIAVWPEDDVSLGDLARWERDGGKSAGWVLRAAACRILVGIPGVLFRVRTVLEADLRRASAEVGAKASRVVEFTPIPGTGCVMATFTSVNAELPGGSDARNGYV